MNRSTFSTTMLMLLAVPMLALGQARSVTRLSIEFQGKTNGSDLNRIASCRQFKPSLQQTIHYFNRAYYLSPATTMTAQETQCYASGSLTYSDGSHADWTLYANGFASMTLRRGDEVKLRYENNAWSDPLARIDDPADN